MRATGTFESTLVQQTPESAVPGRISLTKRFRGDLEASSEGEMLAAVGTVNRSAAYVAMEKVTGTLHGRRGTFVLQHSGIMNRGVHHLSVTIVPDSATGELAGLRGTMRTTAGGSPHSYELEYEIADAAY